MSGVIPSPNIWRTPELYELENQGFDPEQRVESAMRRVRDWRGAVVLDLGCGTGFHLPRLAADAAAVVGVEPHPPLVSRALGRVRAAGLHGRVQVRRGQAQALPVPDASVDVVHARFAYFFGPGCEPGLAELRRVLRRGGVAFVVDHDASRSSVGRWFRQGLPGYDADVVERFWARAGWSRVSLDVVWRHATRADLEAVVRIEFPPEVAEAALAGHPGTEVDHAVVLRWWTRP